MAPTISTFRRVAVLLSPALGDSLLMSMVAHNLQLNGAEVTVFGHQAYFLRAWFPNLRVCAPLSRHALPDRLAGFDTVLQLHRDKPFADLVACHPRIIFLDHIPRASSSEPMVRRLLAFCESELKLDHVERSNGLTPVAGLLHRRHVKRVAIHPTASTLDKCWLASRFVRLGLKLRAAGFDPQFVVAEEERGQWGEIERAGMVMPKFASLDGLASWLYESGWFIGNDSGIGHLASNLEVPTLSLFMRQGIARTWRPDWGFGQVLVGGAFIPTGKLKERYWKYMLSVGRVVRAFDRLRSDMARLQASV